MAMEQRGITTERGAMLREVQAFNAAKAQENSHSMPVEHHAGKGIEQGNTGREVHEHAHGASVEHESAGHEHGPAHEAPAAEVGE